MEEFGGSRIDTSLQLQAIEAKQRKAEKGKRAVAIVLSDNDSGDHTIEEPMRIDNEIPQVTTMPHPSEPTDPHTLEVITKEATREKLLQEPAIDNDHEE